MNKTAFVLAVFLAAVRLIVLAESVSAEPFSSVSQSHEQLAFSSLKRFDYQSAYKEFVLELQDYPHDADAYFNAGNAAQHLQNWEATEKYYRKYLSLEGKGQNADLARQAMEVIENNYLHRGTGNYFADASKGGIHRWSTASMPLKVYIDENSKVQGYKPAFAKSLREAFEEWADASAGRLAFVFTDKASDANIKCSWTAHPITQGNIREGGHTLYSVEHFGKIRWATISFYTLIDERVSSEELLKKEKLVQLHEIGHAMGLGHSKCACDIMYPRTTPCGLEFPLTDRDKQTVVALYAHTLQVASNKRSSTNLKASTNKRFNGTSGWYSADMIKKAVESANR